MEPLFGNSKLVIAPKVVYLKKKKIALFSTSLAPLFHDEV